MFHKALLSAVLVALLVVSFVPARAEAAAPQPIPPQPSLTLQGQVASVSKEGELRVSVPNMGQLVRVLANSQTVITLYGQPVPFSELRVGDQVRVTWQASFNRPQYAKTIEIIRIVNLER